MTPSVLIEALGLPANTRVDQRVPKKLLLEHGAPTAADKRLIQEGVDEVSWVAALKPANIGVSVFKDEAREYLEIAVLTAALRSGSRAARLVELIHRAIPYPVVLWAQQGETASLSLGHKRWSQGQGGEVVVEDLRRTGPLTPGSLTVPQSAFLASIALSEIRAGHLYELYQGWMDRIAALEAATVTGSFAALADAGQAAAQRDALAARTRLQRDLTALRAKAEREKQMGRRVELNLTIRQLETELAATTRALQGSPE